MAEAGGRGGCGEDKQYERGARSESLDMLARFGLGVGEVVRRARERREKDTGGGTEGAHPLAMYREEGF